jgi:hypothetical protein
MAVKRGPKPTLTGCQVKSCPKTYWARGYCKMHYDRIRRHGDPQSDRPPRRGPPAVIGPAVLDVLERDGGWLTVQGILLELDGHGHTARQVNNALRTTLSGLVESRTIELGGARNPRGIDLRVEWRLS